MSCWSCGAPADGDVFCAQCGALQPPRSRDPFSTLGLEPRVEVERAAIDKAFRTRSKDVHPDKHGRKSDTERRHAVQHTTLVNEAYQTLKTPAGRVRALLAMRGVDITADGARTSDPQLLLEMMTLREKMDTADASALLSLDVELKDAVRSAVAAATDYFDRDQGDLEDAVVAMERIRYLERLREQLAARLDE